MNRLPYLDLSDRAFSTRGKAVLEARAAHWCARTPYGLAVLRRAQAGMILRDRRFRQGSHDWPRKVRLQGAFAAFWQRSIISMEGAEHKRLRQIMQGALKAEDIAQHQPEFRRIAGDLLGAYGQSGDFVKEFSEPFAGQAIAALLGMPKAAAKALARDASTLGLAMGIDAASHEEALNAATERLLALADALLRRPPERFAGFAERLLQTAERLGGCDWQAMQDLVVIAIFGGVDTTRAQLAFLIEAFADHPEMWERLRRSRERVPATIEEIIRHRPTTTWASREAIEDVVVDGVSITKGTTVHILVHATATEPDPAALGHGFDPFADRKMHFGFGGGAHHCLGAQVARADMAAALHVLLDGVERIERAGVASYAPDSGNTSPQALPIRLVRD